MWQRWSETTSIEPDLAVKIMTMGRFILFLLSYAPCVIM